MKHNVEQREVLPVTHEVDARRCREALLELSEIVSQITERRRAAVEITRRLKDEDARIAALGELVEMTRVRLAKMPDATSKAATTLREGLLTSQHELKNLEAARRDDEGRAHELTLRIAEEICALEGRRPALFAILPLEVLACHAALVGAGRLPTLASADSGLCGECRYELAPESRRRLDSHFEFCPGCGRFLYLKTADGR